MGQIRALSPTQWGAVRRLGSPRVPPTPTPTRTNRAAANSSLATGCHALPHGTRQLATNNQLVLGSAPESKRALYVLVMRTPSRVSCEVAWPRTLSSQD